MSSEHGSDAHASAAHPPADPHHGHGGEEVEDEDDENYTGKTLRGFDRVELQMGQFVWSHDANAVGRIKFFGRTSFCDGAWVGLELVEAVGKNDGSVNSERYFECEPSFGLFVRPKRVEQYKGPCRQLMNPENVGYLVKRGHVRKNWKKRWFVLKHNVLFYLEEPFAKEPKGDILLTNAKISRADPGSVPNMDFVFIVEDGQSGKTYYISAPSKSQLDTWIELLEKATQMTD